MTSRGDTVQREQGSIMVGSVLGMAEE